MPTRRHPDYPGAGPRHFDPEKVRVPASTKRRFKRMRNRTLVRHHFEMVRKQRNWPWIVLDPDTLPTSRASDARRWQRDWVALAQEINDRGGLQQIRYGTDE